MGQLQAYAATARAHLHAEQVHRGREKVAKKTYIRALGYPLPSFDKWLAQCKADPTWRTHSIDCGHDLLVDRPDELTELLIAAA